MRSVLVLTLALAACASEPGPSATAPPPAVSDSEPATTNPATGLEAPAEPTMPALDPESPEAAVDAVLVYLGAHTDQAASADTLWSPDGPPEGADLSAETFRQSGASILRASVDAPGEPEGAAGSIYIEVPATVAVQAADGSVADRRLLYTLRRVNHVPGADPWTLRWHIDRVVAS